MKTGPKPMGHEVPCIVCGTMIYRGLKYIERTKRITCGAFECRSKAVAGENNPYWGKAHSPEILERIRVAKRAKPHKPYKKRGTPTVKKTGHYRHTAEARAKMSAALETRWRENRDKMLAERSHLRIEKARDIQRYRRNFTPGQRREWKSASCAWCGSHEKLVIDHIVPVMCGGRNERKNAQTLCQPCNIWKMVHVDRALFLAGLGE